MSEKEPGFKPKKSVALSGVIAGSTALSTVGRSGNDLHYRGYDILDIAERCEFEEIAHLLVHERLPNAAELAAYKAKLRAMRGIPGNVKTVLEALPAAAHPMDVMRTGTSALGCVAPEKDDHNLAGARDIADRLMASLGSMLLYWHHFANNGKRIEVETDDDSIGGHLLHLLHGKEPSAAFVHAMHISLNLYAEHEFNASTFAARVIAGTGSDFYSAIAGAIGALRGPKHGGANEFSFEVQSRYASPDEAQADIRKRLAAKEVIIGFGHPVYTVADPRNKIIKEVARRLSQDAGSMTMFDVAERIEKVMWDGEKDVRQSRLVQRDFLPFDGLADRDVHAPFRDRPHLGLERAYHRAAPRQQDHPPVGKLHRPRKPAFRAARRARLMASLFEAARPAPDSVLADIADYVLDYKITSALAYETARHCLIDTLGCGLEALDYPACTKLLGPIVPGTIVPYGAKVPGTSYQLDPVQAAFNIGAMIRWLDFNDTWLAAEWGHPSDNLGGILAVADWLSRNRVAQDRPPLLMRDVLTAMIKAHEIQGVIALENSFNKVGLDHVVLVKLATTAVVSQLLGLSRDAIINALSQVFVDGQALRTYRHTPNTGSRKSWAAGDATSRGVRLALIAANRRDGVPFRPHRARLGVLRRAVPGQAFRIPARLWLLCDGECAVQDFISLRNSTPRPRWRRR